MATKPLSEIVSAKQQVEEKLLNQPGVTGVDVGYKYVGGKQTDDLAIRVMVEKKKASVPAREKVPATIDGVQTDVIERTFFLHAPRNQKPLEELDLQSDSSTYNPVKGGVSVGPVRAIDGVVWAGTLGAIVRDNATGNPLLLSNFHVLAVDEDARTGDAIAQPSLVDGGRDPASVVGTLQRLALTATVDGAVASLQGRNHSSEIVGIGAIAGTGAATPGMAVRKRGRTTGLTHGIVDGISLSITLPYPGDIGPKTLTNQIDVRPDTAKNAEFANHGDSGAVLVDNDGKIVGLHFAGSNDGHGIANPIADVLAALDVSIITGVAKSAQVKEIKIEKEAKAELPEKQKEKNEKFETKDFKDTETITPDKAHQPAEDGGPTMSDPTKTQPKEFKDFGDTGGPMAAAAKPPVEGKVPDKQPVDKPVKSDKEKIEIKENKPEAKETKVEFKEHKNEAKDLKNEAKEHVKDFKEKNDFKEHKNENKELKIELKEHSKIELEKPFRENVKDLVEGGQKFAEGGDPLQSGIAAGGLQGVPAQAGFKIADKNNNLKPEGKIEIKDHKNENKEFKVEKTEHKIENKDKVELKDHKTEIKELKGEKDFKIEQKEHGKPELDKFIDNQKQVFEGGPKLADAGDPFQQAGRGGLQAASAPASAKHVEKIMPDKNQMKLEGKIEIKDHKNENKEFKVEKLEHKDGKIEHKDKVEIKDHKTEIKELKGEKDFKIEQKEHGKFEIGENLKLVFEGGGKINEGGDPFQVNQGALGLQAASAPVAAHKIKENIKSEIEKIKPEKEHIKEIEKIKAEKEFAKDITKDFLIDKNKVEFEKIFPENPKQLVEGGPKLAEGGDPVRPGTPAPGLQGASEPADDSQKEGGAGPQAASATAATAKFPKLEFEKHDKFPKVEFEKHPKLEIEKTKFEGEKVKFEGEKIKFEKEKEFIFDKPFEKIFQEGPKTIAEGGPGFPNLPDPASRIAQLEAAVAQLSTFITQGMRPDLGAGALTNEPDQKPAQPAEGKPAPKAEAKSGQKAASKSEAKSDPKGKKG